MATDYIANAVYGIILKEGDGFLNRVTDAIIIINKGEDEDEDEDDRFKDKVINQLNKTDPGLLNDLKAAFGATDSASLYWTGDPDDRPGRCDVSADEWVFGIGLLSFPTSINITDKFKSVSEWHTWVEAG